MERTNMAVAQFRELQDTMDELVREQQYTNLLLAQLIQSKGIEPVERPHPIRRGWFGGKKS
jgi:hypothetical protein